MQFLQLTTHYPTPLSLRWSISFKKVLQVYTENKSLSQSQEKFFSLKVLVK